MAIQKIKIENFTVFKDVEIEFSPGVNVFIGENGTGKTHLLKLLFASNTTYSSNYLYRIDELFGYRFGEKNCWMQINNEPADPWTITVKNGIISEPETNFHVHIGEKKPSIFIPAKEVLSIANLERVADEYKSSLNIDITLPKSVEYAKKLIPDKIPEFALKIAGTLEKIIEGTVFFDESDQSFWIYKTNGLKVPFTAESEGFKKLGFLWQLIMSKSIKENTVLFWDEPEASINPELIPALVDILLELAKNGVQIFVATHDYNLARYFDVRKNKKTEVLFLNLIKTENNQVICNSSPDYLGLSENLIEAANAELFKSVVADAMTGVQADD